MPTAAFRGGWGVYRGDAASGSTVWTKIPEVITPPALGGTADDIDVTNDDSGSSREFIPGLKDGSEINLEANYVVGNTVHEALRADAIAGNNWEFQIQVDDGTNQETMTFQAAVKGFQYNLAIEEQNKVQFTLKVSGDPVFA